MKPIALIVLMIVALVFPLSGDSLWDPESPGLLSSSGGVQVGDTVLIVLDSNTTLSYASSRVDSERVSLELSGGEAEGLFSFLPGGASSGTQSLKGEEALSLRASFAVSITSIDDTGNLVLQGGRTIVIQGKEETITLSGVADPAFIGDDRSIPFSSIVDARLTYTTLLDSGVGTLRAGDIVTTTEESGPTTDATTPVATETTSEAAPEIEPKEVVSLSEEKRDELMLIYLNRLIDLIFSQ